MLIGLAISRRSTSGFVFLLGNSAISWSSKKQTCIALSTMEVEFVAFSTSVQVAVWLRNFMDHLLDASDSGPVPINYDSQAESKSFIVRPNILTSDINLLRTM